MEILKQKKCENDILKNKSFVFISIKTIGYEFAAFFVLVLLSTQISSCKKFLDRQGPVNSINAKNVYETDATAISVLTGIYANMSSDPLFSSAASFPLLAGLSSDELTLYNGVTQAEHIAYYTNQLVSNANQNYGSEIWSPFYSIIFKCNAAIEGLNSSLSLSANAKNTTIGRGEVHESIYVFLFG